MKARISFNSSLLHVRARACAFVGWLTRARARLPSQHNANLETTRWTRRPQDAARPAAAPHPHPHHHNVAGTDDFFDDDLYGDGVNNNHDLTL